MRQAYFIVGLVLGLAIAVFALQNTGGSRSTPSRARKTVRRPQRS